MDYLKIYNQLINKANRRNAEDGIYYEAHHIVPRCMGGGSDKTNLVKLTAKEHFIAHKLLVEIYPTNGKLIHAYWLMANNKNDDRREYIVGSREYERLKTKHAELISKLFKGVPKVWKDNKVRSKKIGNFHRNKIISDDTRNLISTGLKEYYSNNPSASIGKSHSEETRKKMSEKLKGRVHSEETKKRISETYKVLGISGNPISDVHKENIKKSIQKRKWINDGEVNKKIHPNDSIPDGWVKGRLISEDHKSKIKNK